MLSSEGPLGGRYLEEVLAIFYGLTNESISPLRGTVQEAQEIVNRARMWRWKPYGEVTIRYAQDGNGAPVDLMQVWSGF